MTRLQASAILVALFVLKGILQGLSAGPAPPAQFYVTYHTPFVNSILGNFRFTEYLGEYISNNVGLWMVLFFFGVLFPYIIYDIISYNFYAITRMALYLKAPLTAYILVMHGIYELSAILMVSVASLSLFILIVQEVYALIKKKKFYKPYNTEVKLLFISLGTLVSAAFIEGYVTPLLWR